MTRSSFIYSYNYREKSTAIYTFTYDDYVYGRTGTSSGSILKPAPADQLYCVTLGQELGQTIIDGHSYAQTEYYDADLDIWVGQLKDEHKSYEVGFSPDGYIPYVYTTERSIIVNPKSGNLLEGCGTYEDPYVIDSTRQFMTLYRYLYEEDEYGNLLESQEWSINEPGGDESLCGGSGHVEVTYADITVNANTNTLYKQKLSQAYYVITNDINLTTYAEFSGFGTSELPFVGVFAGGGSQIPSIIMPDEYMGSYYAVLSEFGFIKYAKGVVVKDIAIEFYDEIDVQNTGAGVIATVLGGENIIDNVTVRGITKNGAISNATIKARSGTAVTGGYLGTVKLGGVILRNMSEDSLRYYVSTRDGGADNSYQAGVVGRVLDGYVVYDGASDGNVPLMEGLSSVYFNATGLPMCRNYDIINGAYLQQQCASKIVWTGNGYEIPGGAQLQVMSMALNSGLLNYLDGTNEARGYDNASRQRNGNYDYIGKVTSANAASLTAYSDVIDNDNLVKNDALNPRWKEAGIAGRANRFLDSWLMQFIDWNSKDIFKDGYSAVESRLNPVPEAPSKGEILTWKLTGSLYDMSVYRGGFRGLGAWYNNGLNLWGTPNMFGSHLKGSAADNKAQIKLSIVADKGHASTNVALLNTTARAYYIENYNQKLSKLEIENIVLSGKVTNTYGNAAGFVSSSNCGLAFSNVDLDGFYALAGDEAVDDWKKHYAGGYVAITSSESKISFADCSVQGQSAQAEEKSNRIIARGDAGGFVAYRPADATELAFSDITIEDIEVYSTKTDDGAAGGLVGRHEALSWANSAVLITIGSAAEGSGVLGVTGSNIKVHSDGVSGASGGLIGYSGANNTTVCDTVLTGIEIINHSTGVNKTGYTGAGGLIGISERTVTAKRVTVGETSGSSTVKIDSQVQGPVTNIDYAQYHGLIGSGGFVGSMKHTNAGGYSPAKIDAADCYVLGTEKDGAYTTQISGFGTAGGLAGNNSGYSNLADVQVSGVELRGGHYIGGIIGMRERNQDISLERIRVENCHMSMTANYQNAGDIGGIIGYDDATVTALKDCQVLNIVVDPAYTRNVGGFIGSSPRSNVVHIEAGDGADSGNLVQGCLLQGSCVGGVFGSMYSGVNNNGFYSRDIRVADNKLIAASEERKSSGLSSKELFAGAYAGSVLKTGYLDVERFWAEGNLIASYTANTAEYPNLGGIVGEVNAQIYFYDVDLRNNYIGMLDKSELSTLAGANTSAARRAFLQTTGIETLRDMLNAVTRWDASARSMEKYVNLENMPEINMYKYSFQEGAIVGDNTSSRVCGFINVNVQYDDNRYRPVSDVGISYKDSGASVTGNEAMYQAYRQKYLIVYDSCQTEVEESRGEPSIFGFMNLEDPIISSYEESRQEGATEKEKEKRYIYRLNNDLLQTFKDTYRGKDPYSGEDFLQINRVEGNSLPGGAYAMNLPVVVYSSGDLDQLVSDYADMLTNSSNTMYSEFTGAKANSGALIEVSATAMRIRDGNMIKDTGRTPCIQVENTEGQVHFTNKDASGKSMYDEVTGETNITNATFTVITIRYRWSGEERWVVEIPVFVEKKLEITSNMRMLSGLTYNMGALKASDYYYNEEHTTRYTIDSGSSYSLYAEFVYNNARAKYEDKHVERTITLTNEEGSSDRDIYFAKGTRLTLIDVSNGGKAYFYNVEENCDHIAFGDFEEVRSQKEDGKVYYAYANLESLGGLDTYEDVCGNAYEDVAREQYVLLVDTSQVEIANRRIAYEIHIESTNLERDFFGRADHAEHCYEKVMEIDRITASIYEEADRTYCEENSFIGEDGNVILHLDYNVLAPEAYKQNHRGTHRNLDVAIYLGIKTDNSSQVIRVPLPAGTKVIDLGNNNLTYSVESNSAQVYYYSQLNNGTAVGKKADVMENVQQDVLTDFGVHVQLDFSEADMSFIEAMEGQYYIGADLVLGPVTESPSYTEPPEEGDILDSRHIHVNTINSDVGFAVLPSEVMTLGINRYHPGDTDEGVIPFTTKVALPENYRDVGGVGKYYSVVYTLEEKVIENTGASRAVSYQPYTGKDISLYFGSGIDKAAVIRGSAGAANPLAARTGMLSYQYASGGRSVDNFAIGGREAAQGGFITVDAENGVVTIEGTVEVDTAGMLDWSNYRIKAYLVVSDTAFGAGMTEPELYDYVKMEQELQTDWFVFTIAKVKTDME